MRYILIAILLVGLLIVSVFAYENLWRIVKEALKRLGDDL